MTEPATLAGLTLVIPEKSDPERDSVAAAWSAAGGEVSRLGRFWEPPSYDPAKVRVYGNDTFALVLAQKLGLDLISPADDLLVQLPQQALQRSVTLLPLSMAMTSPFPAFLKPAAPKLFKASVYASPNDLDVETRGLEPDTPVLHSEIVHFACEIRCFVWRGEILDAALYEGDGALEDGLKFARQLAHSEHLPATCVIDIGYIPQRGWATIEANAAWGAGLNGCRAEKVLPCIEAATRQVATDS
ncbi:ATP-grasp domain-containing protein [Hahella aquimaris]|uniref:ATP-grasp domain-containing protein n=1 Tax=Hahella sp. HNIBRBA332 TaxID=3015983 RepID=UPI00273C9730|nr:ATP-grasp domain-containing protein [Hahella sp. HNIBRBA332]WLQ17374.1 ATP-grasp domain-containing protein [Hahella sp. HNIBRBA332]